MSGRYNLDEFLVDFQEGHMIEKLELMLLNSCSLKGQLSPVVQDLYSGPLRTSEIAKSYYSAMQAVLLFCTLVSAVASMSTPATPKVLHGWNACTLVMCEPAEQGIPGRDGRDGIQGIKGEQGVQGLQGPKGSLGPPGKMGPAGPAGQKGDQGNTGPKGDPGQIGPRGIRGLSGSAGNMGPSGPKGNIGPQGEKGVKGEIGLKGALGPAGPQGKIGGPGPAGANGSVGEKGAKGDMGVKGMQGPPGPQGPAGKPGSTGAKGDRGAMGERGIKGDSGLSEVNLLKTKVSAMEGQLKVLQASFAKYQKVAMFPGGRIVGSKVFKANGYEGNFDDLRQRCVQAGGQLAAPRNAAENDAVQKIVLLYNKSAFLGITDLKTEGSFKYLNDQPLTYVNWLPGEPNNDGKENCVELFSNGKWNDKSCGEKRLLVCEF